MPPPKKAAKKVAKKAAKHADHKHHEAKDLRRAYEHLGRIESLQRAEIATPAGDISILVSLAQSQLKDGHAKNAAELLRAAEHLTFGSLAEGRPKQAKLSVSVKTSLEDEHRHLTDKAAEHWGDANSHPLALASIYESSLQTSRQALKGGEYGQALEYIRAAEALAHVEKVGPDKLTAGKSPLSLPRS